MNPHTDEAVKILDLDRAGSAEVVPIDKIMVDTAYQRSMRWAFVNEIAKEYDIVKAGPILVSERPEGTLWCIDGQHRLAAAQMAGETHIFAHVVHGLSQEQEAEQRLARNNRKADTTQEKFRTRLVMGEKKAHQIVALLHLHGTCLNVETPRSDIGINAIATVEQLYDVDDKGVWLSRTLKFLNEAFPETPRHSGGSVDMKSGLNPQTASGSMLKAVAWFIDRHIDTREARWEEAASRIGAAGPEDLRRKAVSHKAAQGGAMWLNFYRALVEVFNFRRTEAGRLQWKTIGSMRTLGDDSSRRPEVVR